MESILQADIFFFVTTVVMIVVGILLAVFLVYAIKLIRDIYIIMEIVREEAVDVIDDIDAFRRNVRHKAARLSGLLGAVTTARFIRRILKPQKDEQDE
ncbi:MAG: hypothetical protein WD335_02335 [Candidatus Paceibacterota bacterium]